MYRLLQQYEIIYRMKSMEISLFRSNFASQTDRKKLSSLLLSPITFAIQTLKKKSEKKKSKFVNGIDFLLAVQEHAF